MTTISKRRRAELAGQAMKYVAELLLIPPMSPAFDHKLEAIEALGRDAIMQLSARHAGSLAHVASPATGGMAQAIAGLRNLAVSLEPLRRGDAQGNLAAGSRLFGLIAAKPDPKAYFQRFGAAQAEIEAALAALTRERDALIRANVTLEAEESAVRQPLAALEEHAVFAEEVALTLTARAQSLAQRDPMAARRLQADALHIVHTRARDIAEARALAQQALAMRSLVRDTNARLIAGIEQALGTMVLVLRTAIEAAQALARQELVLDRIASLNRAASTVIAEHAGAPARASAADLQAAFTRLYDCLDRLESEQASSAARLTDRAF